VVEQRWGYRCRVRDGKVGFFEAYVDPQRAFEAAGIAQA
jgi:ketosteroid isomerase-like protein